MAKTLFTFLLLLASGRLALAADPLVALVSPANTCKVLTREKACAMLRGDMLFLEGKRLVIVLTKPSSASLPAVTFGLLKESPQAFLMRVKAAKLRGVNLDPLFVDSPEAMLAAVAGNAAAVGFLAAKDAKPQGVRILPLSD